MIDPRSDPNGFTVSWQTPMGLLKAVDKLAYWTKVGAIAADLKDKELAKGLDKSGRAMTPISDYTRRHRHSEMGLADPNAPPLTPAHGLSRTRSLLDWKPYLDRVVFFWKFDSHTDESWGVILDYHRKGAGGRLPKRDVIGLSSAAKAKAKADASRWVKERLAGMPDLTPPLRGFQEVFKPRPSVVPKPAPAPRAPLKDFTSDWMQVNNGRFEKYKGPLISVIMGASTRGAK